MRPALPCEQKQTKTSQKEDDRPLATVSKPRSSVLATRWPWFEDRHTGGGWGTAKLGLQEQAFPFSMMPRQFSGGRNSVFSEWCWGNCITHSLEDEIGPGCGSHLKTVTDLSVKAEAINEDNTGVNLSYLGKWFPRCEKIQRDTLQNATKKVKRQHRNERKYLKVMCLTKGLHPEY